MNLEEFRKALSSDATEENAQLKRQLSDLYPCPHMPGLEEQVAMAHKLRKEIEKNG